MAFASDSGCACDNRYDSLTIADGCCKYSYERVRKYSLSLTADPGEAMLDNALDGFNNCLCAYGQTGSGKTFSVLGASSLHWSIHNGP